MRLTKTWKQDPDRAAGGSLSLSASDLSQFLACRHLTALELGVARGERVAATWVDPMAAVLRQRGQEHERAYAEGLRAQGLGVLDLGAFSGEDAVTRTLEAMHAGVDVILQAAFWDGRWFGRPDVLRRVDAPSNLGAWSYQVEDTKLAKETKAGTILQLGLYSEMLGILQGHVPESFRVVSPGPEGPVGTDYRTEDYAAYFRFVRRRLEATVLEDAATLGVANYPESVEHELLAEGDHEDRSTLEIQGGHHQQGSYRRLVAGKMEVLGGVPWLWGRPEAYRQPEALA